MQNQDYRIANVIFHPAIYGVGQTTNEIKELIEKFLQEGGDINQESDRGRTIFGIIKFSGRHDVKDILDFLKTKGSNEAVGDFYKNMPDIKPRTLATITPQAEEKGQQTPSGSPHNSSASLSSVNSTIQEGWCNIL
jgi:hypothetical protein